jgi:mannose-6-phosphate isomerase
MTFPLTVVGVEGSPQATRVRRVSDDESVRPWGHYEVLSDGPDFKAKTITVRPGKRLSYQRHERRAEHWFVVKGTGVVTLDGASVDVEPGSAVDVPVGAAHRIHNTHDESELVFVEVQHGEYFGEDDIVRLEDDYGRSG